VCMVFLDNNEFLSALRIKTRYWLGTFERCLGQQGCRRPIIAEGREGRHNRHGELRKHDHALSCLEPFGKSLCSIPVHDNAGVLSLPSAQPLSSTVEMR
jgi:hypothetical protein